MPDSPEFGPLSVEVRSCADDVRQGDRVVPATERRQGFFTVRKALDHEGDFAIALADSESRDGYAGPGRYLAIRRVPHYRQYFERNVSC